MGEEVESLLEKGAIEQDYEDSPGFYFFLFLVPKKEGGQRPVINLKPLNEYIRKKPFHMTTLKEVGQAIRHGDWSITIDLQDAFLHVPKIYIHRESVPVSKTSIRTSSSKSLLYVTFRHKGLLSDIIIR